MDFPLMMDYDIENKKMWRKLFLDDFKRNQHYPGGYRSIQPD
jgi:hypothetical protein